MNQIRYTIPQYVVILPEITTECKQRAMNNFTVKKLVNEDKNRYMMITFLIRNGATYLYDKQKNTVVGRIDRRLLNDVDTELVGNKMQCYKFV